MSKKKTYNDGFKTMIGGLVLLGKLVKELADEYRLSQTAVRNSAKERLPLK